MCLNKIFRQHPESGGRPEAIESLTSKSKAVVTPGVSRTARMPESFARGQRPRPTAAWSCGRRTCGRRPTRSHVHGRQICGDSDVVGSRRDQEDCTAARSDRRGTQADVAGCRRTCPRAARCARDQGDSGTGADQSFHGRGTMARPHAYRFRSDRPGILGHLNVSPVFGSRTVKRNGEAENPTENPQDAPEARGGAWLSVASETSSLALDAAL